MSPGICRCVIFRDRKRATVRSNVPKGRPSEASSRLEILPCVNLFLVQGHMLRITPVPTPAWNFHAARYGLAHLNVELLAAIRALDLDDPHVRLGERSSKHPLILSNPSPQSPIVFILPLTLRKRNAYLDLILSRAEGPVKFKPLSNG